MILEIFGPFQESSLPGLWRGLVATAVVLAAVAVLRPSDLGCLRIFVGTQDRHGSRLGGGLRLSGRAGRGSLLGSPRVLA
jgi:hypothetical protein